MNDVFISYSRRDKVFTQKLFEALKAQGREIWADWEDIPPGSDWFAEIKQGVEESQSVLFVLSPEWIKSNECRKELDYAVQMGKRLVPVIWQNIDPKDAPPELAKINWIFMREGDDFDKGFQLVSATLDTDLDWLKAHTRLQTRALEWDKKNKDNSFVLRGKDLEDAEQFLSQGSHKDPEPTSLQGDYILISRKEAVRVQRMILSGVIAALVIAVVLGIVAAFQWQAARRAEATAVVERDNAIIAQNTAVAAQATAVFAEGVAVTAKETAVAERDRADQNATIALSRELAARSIQELDIDPELSLLLALQAINTTQEIGQPIIPDADNALRRALQTSRLRYTIRGDAEVNITAVALSPDGKYLAMAAWDEIEIFELSALSNTANPKPVASFQSSGTNDMVFSADGTALFMADGDGTVGVWDVDAKKSVGAIPGHSAGVNKVAIDPSGKYLVSGSNDGSVRVLNLNDSNVITITDHIAESEARGRATNVSAVAISPDGNIIASGGWDGWVILSDASTGNKLFAYDNWSTIMDIAFSPDGKYIAWGDAGYSTKVMDITTDEIVFEQKYHTDQITRVAFSPDGSLLASSSFDDTVTVMNASDGKLRYTLRGDNQDVLDIAFSPDGQYLATSSIHGVTKLWGASAGGAYEAGWYQGDAQPVLSVAYGPDGNWLATSSSGSFLAYLWPLNGGSVIPLSGHTADVNDITFSPDGKEVLTGSWDGLAMLWDSTSGTQISSLENANNIGVLGIAFSPDGTLAVGALDDGTVAIWDVNSGQVQSYLDTQSEVRLVEIAFSPDGTQVATVGLDYMIRTWNVSTGALIHEFERQADWVYAVAFSPDGTRILTGCADRSVTMWNTESASELFTVKDFAASVNGVAFNPAGTLFAVASSDGTAKIFSADNGTLLTTLSSFAGPVNDVAFSPDGKQLATGSDDGVARTFFVSIADVIELARTRITRSLTDAECRAFLHQAVCPSTVVKPGDSSPIQVVSSTTSTVGALRSGDGTVDVTVSITNNSTEYFTLYWVDWDGIEQYYGDIAPNSTFEQPTYNTHAWRIRDAAGNVVAEYVATDQATQKITINADKTVELP